MNRSLLRAWLLAVASLGIAAPAAAQIVPFDQDWIWICDDPTTDDQKFSNDYGRLRHQTDLFGVMVGVSGTATFETCFGNPSFTADVAGRIGFQIGTIGSIQDEATEGLTIDDNLQLNPGMPNGIGGNFGYAKIVRQTAAGARTFTAWGDGGVDGFYTGASDRYMQLFDTVDNVLVRLRVDVIGDGARFQWDMTNQGTATDTIGLWFGQYVVGLGPQGLHGMKFIKPPGRRPIITATRFSQNPVQSNTIPELALPDRMDFGLSQARAYGLSVILQPSAGSTSAFNDQTAPTYFDIGGAGFSQQPSLLGPANGNGRPANDTFSYAFFEPDLRFVYPDDEDFLDDVGYLERWEPIAGGTATRRIIAYYKSTTGVSDYARPYTAVVDGPKTIGVSDSNPFVFNPDTQTIRVYLDNVRGFATNGKLVPLFDVRVTVDLPTGMYDANDVTKTKTKIVKTVARVEPNNTAHEDPSDPLSFVDFQVKVAPNFYGTQTYRVTIEPQPGATKVIESVVNIATQPRLLLREQANLVGAPWDFTTSSWSNILAKDPNDPNDIALQQDIDYQAFGWDAQRQEYRVVTGPSTGVGYWLIAARNIGVKKLNGGPKTPSTLRNGADPIVLRPGWNLIANPYPYPIELGQIVSVADDNNVEAVTFEELVAKGTINGALAFWDTNTQSYKFISDISDQMVPNRGYWIRVNSTNNVTLRYPPVFTPFIPRGTGGITASAGWLLNLVARSTRSIDDQNYVGIAANDAQARSTRLYEPPIAPLKGAISAAIVEANQRYAKSLKAKANTLTWDYAVNTRDSGAVTLTWPNASQMPSNVNLTLVDVATNSSVDMRKVSSVTFLGRANSSKAYRIVATTTAVNDQITDVSATPYSSAVTIKYKLTGTSRTSVRILKSGTQITALTSNRTEAAGAKTLSWNYRDSANRLVSNGVYTVEVKSIAPNGTTETKTTTVLVSR